MIFILSTLLYYKKNIEKSSIPMIVLQSYGIESDGFVNINIFNSSSSKVFISFFDEENNPDLIWNSSYDYHKLCDNDKNKFYSSINYTAHVPLIDWNYTFQEKKVYYPVFISCDISDKFILNYSIMFRNKKSNLDFREKLLILTHPILLLLYLLLMIFIIVSLIGRFSIYMKFHNYLFITILMSFISLLTEFNYYMLKRTHFDVVIIFCINYLFYVISQILLFTLLCLAGSGWEVHTTKFPMTSFIITFICGCIYPLFNILQFFIDNRYLTMEGYAFEMLILFVLSKVILSELRKCEKLLMSYDLIVNSVYQVSTTPVHQRGIMQYIFLCTFCFYMFAKFVSININLFVILPIWINILTKKLIDFIVLLVLSINYLVFRYTKEDWYNTFNDESELIAFPVADFVKEEMPDNKRKRFWSRGDPLPNPPILSETEHILSIDEIEFSKEDPMIEELVS